MSRADKARRCTSSNDSTRRTRDTRNRTGTSTSSTAQPSKEGPTLRTGVQRSLPHPQINLHPPSSQHRPHPLRPPPPHIPLLRRPLHRPLQLMLMLQLPLPRLARSQRILLPLPLDLLLLRRSRRKRRELLVLVFGSGRGRRRRSHGRGSEAQVGADGHLLGVRGGESTLALPEERRHFLAGRRAGKSVLALLNGRLDGEEGVRR